MVPPVLRLFSPVHLAFAPSPHGIMIDVFQKKIDDYHFHHSIGRREEVHARSFADTVGCRASRGRHRDGRRRRRAHDGGRKVTSALDRAREVTSMDEVYFVELFVEKRTLIRVYMT